ncbi:molecular chaperone DnaJ [Desulfobaculum xiamenense]|uniref:Molecular chaperone DnaJ n=1 Tax=Desulfobaculum xiamenense TaxID=995050 RepID=A0A846QLK8_9BACT|nr:molecular chaperone DnaJ [Desulfobaculum xiamenense]
MNVRECYSFLRLKPGAGLQEVKTAYRKRAFELHPDLHPGNPDAAAEFQKLNEAYVILTEALKDERGAPRQSRRPEADAKAKTSREEGARRYKAQADRKPGPTPPPGPEATTTRREAEPTGGFTFGKEDVLRNILNDPFARKVFEDIYRQIRKSGTAPSHTATVKNRSLSLRLGSAELNLNLNGGPLTWLKNWVKGQMDDEQTVHLLPSQLLPGCIVRLQIRRGFSSRPITVEVPLPPDFVAGRPLRLRGLGRKLGPLKGDLYLRLVAR